MSPNADACASRHGCVVPQHRAETTRVVKAQNLLPKLPIDVIVFLWRSVFRHDAQTAGHAEVNQQRATASVRAADVDRQIFTAPLGALDAGVFQPLGQLRVDRPAQRALAHHHARDGLSFDVWRHAHAGDFHFG